MTKNSGGSGARKIVDARENRQGRITHVLIEGNQNFTPVDTAIRMTERNELEGVHVVHQSDGDKYLRTNPDGTSKNNLDTLAQD